MILQDKRVERECVCLVKAKHDLPAKELIRDNYDMYKYTRFLSS